MEVKHREHYFSFDIGLYKNWTARAEIWLEEELEEGQRRTGGPRNKRNDDDTLAPGLQDTDVNEEDVNSCSESENEEEGTERGTSSDTSLHHLPGTHGMNREMGDDTSCVCVPGCGENKSPAGALKSPIARSGLHYGSLISIGLRKDVQRKEKGVKSGKPFRVEPLPGLLDHRDFKRVKVVSSRCDICHTGAAVFWCAEKQIGVCEGCYAKMVREWNREKGVK